MNNKHDKWKTIQAALNEVELKYFKEHPVVRKWLLSTSEIQIEEIKKDIYNLSPELYSKYVKDIQENSIGSKYPSHKISKKTLVQMYYIVRCLSYFNLDKFESVSEIGGGYGNLAYECVKLNLCNHYDIFDIKNVIEIQNYYLNRSLKDYDFEKITLHNIDDEGFVNNTSNLSISTFALTEMPISVQKEYIEKVLKNSNYLYVVGQKFFDGQNLKDYLKDELSKYFVIHEYKYKYYDKSRETFEWLGIKKDE